MGAIEIFYWYKCTLNLLKKLQLTDHMREIKYKKCFKSDTGCIK